MPARRSTRLTTAPVASSDSIGSKSKASDSSASPKVPAINGKKPTRVSKKSSTTSKKKVPTNYKPPTAESVASSEELNGASEGDAPTTKRPATHERPATAQSKASVEELPEPSWEDEFVHSIPQWAVPALLPPPDADRNKKRPCWSEEENDRFELSRLWSIAEVKSAWASLGDKIKALVALIVDELPDQSYEIIASAKSVEISTNATLRPSLFYNNDIPNGRAWLLEAWLWDAMIQVMGPRPIGELPSYADILDKTKNDWAKFAELEDTLMRYDPTPQGKYTDFLPGRVIWRALSTRLLFTKSGCYASEEGAAQRMTDVLNAVWLGLTGNGAYFKDEYEGERAAAIRQVAVQAVWVHTLIRGLPHHYRFHRISPGGLLSFTPGPYTCLGSGKNKKNARVQIVLQPGLTIYNTTPPKGSTSMYPNLEILLDEGPELVVD